MGKNPAYGNKEKTYECPSTAEFVLLMERSLLYISGEAGKDNTYSINMAVMKAKLFYCGLVLFAATLISCSQKEEIGMPEMITITFSADKAGADTKTAAVEGVESVSYVWTSE